LIYSLLIIVALVVFIIFNKKWRLLPEEQRAKQLKKAVLWGVIGAVLLLVVMGRAHWLMGVLAGFVAVLGRLAAVAKYFPLLRFLMGNAEAKPNQNNNVATSNDTMTVKQAADILAVEPSATKGEVVLAHKKLMQKVHPDRGGSDALAAQINQAKQVMLDQLA